MTCECGCGEETNIATRTDTAKGYVRGQPLRFVRGHYVKVGRARGAYLDEGEAERRAVARRRAWRERNIERVTQLQAERFQANKQAIIDRRRESGQAVKHSAARRARKQGAFVEHVEPFIVLEMGDGVCGICDEDVDPFDFVVEHIVPLCIGGEHSYANTQPAHALCNLRKAAN